jgi:hypothetical protein
MQGDKVLAVRANPRCIKVPAWIPQKSLELLDVTRRRSWLHITSLWHSSAGRWIGHLTHTAHRLFRTHASCTICSSGCGVMWARSPRHTEPTFIIVVANPPTLADRNTYVGAMFEFCIHRTGLTR